MKKILYTVSAIVLGLTASGAQAETGTKIAPYQVVHPQVDFVSTFGLTKGTELKFGVVVNPQVGQKITVSPNNELSGSYEGASTGNATLLGVGTLGSTANTINVSTVSRGSVTITGNVATLNKAGTVRLQFPDEIPLSDGITCGTVKLNPVLDGKDPNSTADDDVLSTAREVLYGGTLTLSTNETGKHCVGSGQVTLIFDESAVFAPDDHSNDPVDNFSLIPPEPEPAPVPEVDEEFQSMIEDYYGAIRVYGEYNPQLMANNGDEIDINHLQAGDAENEERYEQYKADGYTVSPYFVFTDGGESEYDLFEPIKLMFLTDGQDFVPVDVRDSREIEIKDYVNNGDGSMSFAVDTGRTVCLVEFWPSGGIYGETGGTKMSILPIDPDGEHLIDAAVFIDLSSGTVSHEPWEGYNGAF